MDERKELMMYLFESGSDKKRFLLNDSLIKKYIFYERELDQKEKMYIEELTGFKFYENDKIYFENFYDIYDDNAKDLIKASGKDLVKALNKEGLSNIVYNVLCGGNVRDTMEFMTRNRLIISNASLLELFSEIGHYYDNDWEKKYLEDVSKSLLDSKNDSNRILNLWLLGLTKKGLDNIVRGKENLFEYKERLYNTFNETNETLESKFGNLRGQIIINNQKIQLDWKLINIIFMAIGAQTLSIRGSSKSMSGKMFEKLVLGSCLTLMGFDYLPVTPTEVDFDKKCFWLSSVSEAERETDATITYKGKAISIDIGFIGKGNPEIASDKLTRFRSYKEIGKINHLMRTIVIVDTIGNNSNLTLIANNIEGSAIEMKNKFWVKQFATILSNFFDVNCNVENIKEDELHKWLEKETKNIDFSQFIKNTKNRK
ncbi:CfrBI family restriction endonuclease [Staphylococcus carnosus]|uniref:CfrBI family restriction endonuclease n=1 Tax=Staphylococcus carnosus TaxID=1281 RepID=UPI0006AB8540|nr:CfrBI family restriction endonuclease [Staphylococcus carnosus]